MNAKDKRLIEECRKMLVRYKILSIPYLQRKFKLSFDGAKEIMYKLGYATKE